eukprot:10913753-Alexandrium_andersonii.AAC.1
MCPAWPTSIAANAILAEWRACASSSSLPVLHTLFMFSSLLHVLEQTSPTLARGSVCLAVLPRRRALPWAELPVHYCQARVAPFWHRALSGQWRQLLLGARAGSTCEGLL